MNQETSENYGVVENDTIVAVIIWDGETPYDPGEGKTLIKMADLPEGAWIGWVKIGDTWQTPPDEGDEG